MSLPTKNILYHGTAEKIFKIDVQKGRNNKDFENLGIQYFVGKQNVAADKLITSMKEVQWS